MNMKQLFLLLYLFTAVLEDFRSCKIPNRWILFGLGIGTLALLEEREALYLDYVIGCILPLILLFLLYCIRVLGAGDIKLLMVCGLFLGKDAVLQVIAGSFLFGGIYAFVRLIRTKSFRQRFGYLLCYVKRVAAGGRIEEYVEGDWEKESVLHFSLCILLGCLPVIGGMI